MYALPATRHGPSENGGYITPSVVGIDQQPTAITLGREYSAWR
jgi:hypothetical protein